MWLNPEVPISHSSVCLGSCLYPSDLSLDNPKPTIFKKIVQFFLNSFIFNWIIIALQCCQFLLDNEVSQPYVCLLSLPLTTPSHPPGHHRAQAELALLYTSFPPAACFTHGRAYMSTLLSQFIPSFPSPSVSLSPFSTCASLFLPYKLVHQCHFFWIPCIGVPI